LRFVTGIIDSKDLSLNINRETLQNNKSVEIIKRSLSRRILESIRLHLIKYKEKQESFINNFGEIIKEGLYNNKIEHEKEIILSFCKFYSTKCEKMISLDDYVVNMKSSQKEIYILNGERLSHMKDHPQLEGFNERGIEVLLLKDHIDNFWINSTYHYKNKFFRSVTSGNVNLNQLVNKNEVTDVEKYKKLLLFIKQVLEKNVTDVVISSKLVKSPVCISTANGNINLKIEKLLLNQDKSYPKIKKIFEINPLHPILQKNR
jgi:molecular chaperone HtpG